MGKGLGFALGCHLGGVLLRVAPLGDDAVEELASRHQLHHEHHLVRARAKARGGVRFRHQLHDEHHLASSE